MREKVRLRAVPHRKDSWIAGAHEVVNFDALLHNVTPRMCACVSKDRKPREGVEFCVETLCNYVNMSGVIIHTHVSLPRRVISVRLSDN